MLEVISLEEAASIVQSSFAPLATGVERVALDCALGRAIAANVVADQGIPPFDRSMVDGFAVRAHDTFGCSEGLPALLELAGEVFMGQEVACVCEPGRCVRIPTGGKVPKGADAVVMLEYCEEYGDGTIGIAHPVAPGDNIVFANDDVAPGAVLIPEGARLLPHHVGTLASLGILDVDVRTSLVVGIISTGDEIVDVSDVPVASQMRDVNAPMLASAVRACGACPKCFPIVPDEYRSLHAVVAEALETCDVVLVSGGSSAGQKDNTPHVLAALSEVLFHGIAVKPGKPTLCASAQGKPLFGLPGHPVAAYFMFLELVCPLLAGPQDARLHSLFRVQAALSQGVPSNHGRAELVGVRLQEADGGLAAVPVHGKSGLISQLNQADGYIVIGRNQEGLAAGSKVSVRLFGM